MFASELADEIRSAREAEFPGVTEQRFPSKFFNPNIFVKQPGGFAPTPRNPRYCATNYGAACLASVLYSQRGLECLVSLAPAMGWTELKSGPFEDSEPVPYLTFRPYFEFTSGLEFTVRINAGSLLDFFNHNYPAIQVALNSVHADVVRTGLEVAGRSEDEIKAHIEAIMALTK